MRYWMASHEYTLHSPAMDFSRTNLYSCKLMTSFIRMNLHVTKLNRILISKQIESDVNPVHPKSRHFV